METHWRTRLRASLGDGPELDTALAEIITEARSACIEITEDGQIASSALGKEYYRVPFELRPDGFQFKKPDGPVVEVTQPDDDTVVAVETGKPTMTFRRVEE
jgi:hypothetical protein